MVFRKSLLFCCLVFTFSVASVGSIELSDERANIALYDDRHQKRLMYFNKIISVPSELIHAKLDAVNHFFNKFKYVEDIELWGKKDYWASPSEFLEKGAGDCEDYAISKFFTLALMGVSVDKMRFAYVRSKKLSQAHMVLLYYAESHSEPLVLDNIIQPVLLSGLRKDLIPVYTFGYDGLWMISSGFKPGHITSTKRLKSWMSLLKKINNEGGLKLNHVDLN